MFRIFAAACIAVVASCTGTPAQAHQAMSGWAYPASCCSGHDCAEIPAEAVAEHVRDGFVVTVAPGAHPMWPVTKPGSLKVSIPYLDTRASPDGRFHLCIDSNGKVLCFYAGYGGS